MARFYGWKRQQPDHRDYQYALAERALPPSVDLRTKQVMRPPLEPNLDQGQLGSCGPNSAAAVLLIDMLAAGVAAPMPSRLFVYYATRALMGTTGQDSGVDNRTLLKALAKSGWCDESLWPYDISHFTAKPSTACYAQAATRLISQYVAVPQTLAGMKQCLADGFPFIFGFTVYESFESAAVAKTGVVPMPTMAEKVLGGHDVCIVGYDDATQRFIFKNSWGESWGAKGDGTIPYAYATNPNLSGDFWTIKGAGIVPTPPSPTPTPVPVGTFDVTLRIDPVKKTAVQVA